MGISRLFTEIGAKSTMPADLQASMTALENIGLKATGSGKAMIAAFNDTLNPTTKLTDQISLLEAAGKAEADILAVMKDKIVAAGDAATANGQPMSDLTKKYYDMAKATNPDEAGSAGFSIKSFGETLTNFAKDPIGSAKQGIVSLLEGMGPTAVGIAGIATAAVAAGASLFKFGSDAADQYEKMQNLSAMTGIAVGDLQALTRIAKEAGLEGLDLGRTLSKINEQLGDPKANDFTKALDYLGISTKDTAGKTKDAVTALDEIRNVLLQVKDPTDRAQLAQQALGGRLRELIPLLLNSNKSLKDWIQEMDDAGIKTNALTNNYLAIMDEQLDKTGRTWEAVGNKAKLGVSAIWVGISNLITSGAWSSFTSGQFAVGFLDGSQKAKDKTDQLTGSVDANTFAMLANLRKYDEMVEKWKEEQEQKKKEEWDKLNTAWTDSITPLSSISTEFTKLKTVGADVNTFVKLHRDEIVEAGTKQVEFTGKLSDTDAELLEMAMSLQKAKTDTDSLNASAKQAKIDQDALKATWDGISLFIDDKLTKSMSSLESSMDKIKPEDPLEDFFPDEEELGSIKTRIEDAALSVSTSLSSVGTAFSGSMGKAVDDISTALANALIEWKNPAGSIINAIKDMGKNMLTALIDAFLTPFKNALTSIAGGIGNWLGGLVTGNGTGLSGLWKSIGGGAAGIAGLFTGGTAAAGTAAAASGISLDAALAGGAGSGFWGTLGAFATNPITLGVAGGAALGYLGYRMAKGQSTWGAGAKEVARDMGGVDVGSDVYKDFLTSMGTDPKEMWNYRKDTMFAPQFLTYVYGAAAEQGKTSAFLSSLQNITTAMGTGNFRGQFEDFIKTGNATGINQAYMDLFGRDVGFTRAVGGDLSQFLLPGTNVSGTPPQNNITININAPTYGIEGLDNVIAESVNRVMGRGGLSPDQPYGRRSPGIE